MAEEIPGSQQNSPRFPLIPFETQQQMKADRAAGMTLEQIAEKYHCSVNSVRKYTGDVIKSRQRQPEVANETEINSEVEKAVLSQHAGKILDYSKKRDSEIIAAGEAVQRHLAEKGINIDIDQIPPVQLIKLLKSPLGDDMNISVKNIFENWLEQQLSSLKTGAPAVEGKQKISFEDIKEIMMLNFLARMTNQGDSPQDNSQVEKLIAENEKLRQDFRAELEKNRQEMKDLVLEKRLQIMDEKQADVVNTLSTQLEGLQQGITQLKSVPNPSPEQKNALSVLSEAVSDINKIKGSLINLGIVSSAPGTPAPTAMDVPEAFKNPDGSVNTIPYIIGRLADVAKPAVEAHFKTPPEKGKFVETPAPAQQDPQYTERRMSEEEYAEFLLSRPSLTPEQQQWLTNYRNYLTRQHAPPQTKVQETPAPAQEQRVLTFEDHERFYNSLLQKPSLSAEEQAWIADYIPVRSQYLSAAQPVSPGPIEGPAEPAKAVPEPTPVKDLPEAAAVESVQPVEKIGILEKLKAAEEQQAKALEGLI